MTPDQPAVLSGEQGRSVLRFERLLAHPPERVWRALIEPGELAHWHPSPFELDGVTPAGEPDGQRIPSGWPELNREYERRFGIAPEQATPPPRT